MSNNIDGLIKAKRWLVSKGIDVNGKVTELKIMKVVDLLDEYSKEESINNQVNTLQSVLKELMTGFDSEEDKMDFILDVCNGYRKKLESKE